MKKNKDVYIKLQQHLDSQAVGFPATRSGVELKILQHIFTPREAEIATCLSYKFEPIETLYKKTAHIVQSVEELAQQLDAIQKKGGIESKIEDGSRQYCNAPLVVGMYEMQLDRLTPEFIDDFKKYTRNPKFGIEFLSTELPQMRTIPVNKSIQVKHSVSTFDEVKSLIDHADAPFVIIECICRKKKDIEGKPCKLTSRKETCLAMAGIAQSVLRSGLGREISREEAMDILEKNQQQGLILQPSNARKAEFICSCCGCCCGMLNIHKQLPSPLEFWASNFQAVIDENKCDGCGVCVKRCQSESVTVSTKKKQAVIDLNRCLGCGVCVVSCPKKAISLEKKKVETCPPATREELHEIIMASKKGTIGKLKLAGKLVLNTIRTAPANVFKK